MGCRNAVVLNAPSDTVWEALRDFHDLSWSANVVEDVEVVGEALGTQVGARRVLNGVFHETLQEMDEAERTFRYSIDEGPGPLAPGSVAGYVGEVRVVPVSVPEEGAQTVVIWNSDWASESGGVREFCDPIYKALLGDLKARFG